MSSPAPPQRSREWLLRTLAAATFLIFFQAFMVAPLIPQLAHEFRSSTDVLGLAIPAYLVPYGAMTLLWGPLSDRIGRKVVILGSAAAFVVLTALTALADGPGMFIAFRLLTALGASGVVPISLALIGDVFPYQRRGHALGWLFGAMAGGMAFGSSAGALLEPLIGWQGLFLGAAALAAIVLVALTVRRSQLQGGSTPQPRSVGPIARGYLTLLTQQRARRTYGYVLINAVIHSGIYTWLGLYFSQRFGLTLVGIGLALLLYGVPGFLFGPAIGRLADRYGRARLIPLGLAVAATAALLLALPVPLILAALAVGILSLGYDLTQPLLAGIVTQLSAQRGQAMGLNVCTLFIGFGAGSLLFQALLATGFTAALAAFGTGAALAAVIALHFFASETPQPTPSAKDPR
ncbi:MFS transporter [Mycobacterium gordonae]|uniref:MFS transporter n=1 Tax=Mycobacterium gordonae TaxID=1778 RepID=A0A0Q2MI49_MYCGO|nr:MULTISPECIES: MFS transporter [Mycobacterium]KQH79503.1 MFS transporter [Mycobacterium gordonae]